MTRATEDDVALGVMQIAAANLNGVCTFRRAYNELPKFVKFDPRDEVESTKRPGEPMWQQLVRNIRSHHETAGNFIARGLLEHVSKIGYRITPAGRAYLKAKGL